MLDAIPFPAVMTDLWQEHLSHGDIVLFRFPLAEGSEAAPIKARPCLVLDIQTIGSTPYALIAYGTSSRRRSNVGDEIHIRKREAVVAAGLNEPTRFIGARRVLVPLTHSGFVIPSGAVSPVIGQLEGRALERMNAVRARIHALRDIAAHHRSNTSRRPVRSFTVERRHPNPKQLQKGAAA